MLWGFFGLCHYRTRIFEANHSNFMNSAYATIACNKNSGMPLRAISIYCHLICYVSSSVGPAPCHVYRIDIQRHLTVDSSFMGPTVVGAGHDNTSVVLDTRTTLNVILLARHAGLALNLGDQPLLLPRCLRRHRPPITIALARHSPSTRIPRPFPMRPHSLSVDFPSPRDARKVKGKAESGHCLPYGLCGGAQSRDSKEL